MNPPPPDPASRRGRLGQRLFAWMMTHGGDPADPATILRKQALFGKLQGQILEIGPGAGPNLPFFPPGSRWIGVEPNPYMHPALHQAIQGLGRPFENYRIHPGDPQGLRLPAADESIDAVVSTHVLCSVPDLEGSLAEILRVLKPGGRFVFIEHVAARSGTGLRRMQNVIQPLWSLAADGCHPNRETEQAIAQAGFAKVEIEQYRYPGGGLVGPHIAGQALKRE